MTVSSSLPDKCQCCSAQGTRSRRSRFFLLSALSLPLPLLAAVFQEEELTSAAVFQEEELTSAAVFQEEELISAAAEVSSSSWKTATSEHEPGWGRELERFLTSVQEPLYESLRAEPERPRPESSPTSRSSSSPPSFARNEQSRKKIDGDEQEARSRPESERPPFEFDGSKERHGPNGGPPRGRADPLSVRVWRASSEKTVVWPEDSLLGGFAAQKPTAFCCAGGGAKA